MFNRLITSSLQHRHLVLAASVLLLFFGLNSIQKLPVDVLPDLNKPSVTLLTEAPGMAPEDVEQQITFPIETAMNGLPSISRVRSVSGIGLSIVYVEFGWDADLYFNRQLVSERLQLVKEQLPDGISPQMGPVTSIMGEIMLVALTGNDQVNALQLRETADYLIRPRLLSIPGVAQVIPIGGGIKQYRITPDFVLLNDLGLSIQDLHERLAGFAENASGGFLEDRSKEYLIRTIGRTTSIKDLKNLVVGSSEKHSPNSKSQSVILSQVADVKITSAVKRGDGSFNAGPAVILSIQKQPGADTVELTKKLKTTLIRLDRSLPTGMKANNIIFKQADFIQRAVSNVAEALRDGALLVVIILFLFMLDVRVAFVTLTAIPASILITALIFSWFELSINTMTLGGLAIAIGELVDDAIVGVENVRRRLRQAPPSFHNINRLIQLVADATIEVRSAILYATLIIALVFVPLFALGNIEGRMFIPLGIAYIVSILASMFVSMTLTPVLSLYLLPKVSQAIKQEGALIRVLKKADEKLLNWAFDHHKFILSTVLVIVLSGAATVPFFARAFLPTFNEGTLTVSVVMKPGTSLTESNKIGQLAESLLLSIPEVSQVGRRTGRAELDEHAEGVHYSEIDAALVSSVRSRKEVLHDVRTALSNLPAFISVGQPISHRLDHLLSGVRAELVLKIFGPDIDRLRTLSAQWSERLSSINGLVDLQVEKQVLIPQLQIQIDYDKARLYDVTPTAINRAIATLSNGEKIAEIIDDNRFYDVVLRLSEKDRNEKGLANLLVDTPHGPVPLNLIAEVREGLGPNQINRENGQRRIVVYANRESGADMAAVVEEIRMIIAATALPKGYYISLEGQFLAQEVASKQIALLALFALIMIFLLLNNRYKSPLLSLIIMGNIPMALVGSVAALYLSGGVLSIASLIGFITLAGISSRNGILKISHYIHLAQFEGEQFGKKMIIRGSIERLIPVLMTALTAIFALIPLLLAADEPGKEILHPVAVVIFGGLISAVILDTIVTPVMFYLWGEKPLLKLLKKQSA